jgi:6-phosphogluconolactonase
MTKIAMKKSTLVQIWKTRDELEKSVTFKLFDVIRRSLNENVRCCIALSGGETPKNVYRQMGQDETNRLIDWNRVHIFFCDERAVPPDHPNSNYGMIMHEWISYLSIPQENVHRMKGEIDPNNASKEYEQEIRNVFGLDPVIFDFILLGVGDDGHTASLFPGSDVVREKNDLVRSAFSQHFNNWRVTLTVPVLNAAREIIFLAAGKHKASIVQCVLDVKVPDTKLPASLIRPTEGTLCWMIDEQAGSLLKEYTSITIEKM